MRIGPTWRTVSDWSLAGRRFWLRACARGHSATHRRRDGEGRSDWPRLFVRVSSEAMKLLNRPSVHTRTQCRLLRSDDGKGWGRRWVGCDYLILQRNTW